MAQILSNRDIEILNDILKEQRKLIQESRFENQHPYNSNINLCGAPEIVPLYEEIYKSIEINNHILALVGIRIFLEEFIKILWVASEVRRQQLSGRLGEINQRFDFRVVYLIYNHTDSKGKFFC